MALLLPWLACASDPSPPPAPTGNVLIVVLDDVGVDKLAGYGLGADPPPTPTVDRLMNEGVTFRQAWAYPTCSPSRASLLTGRPARQHGIGLWLDPWLDTWDLQDEELTLPELLRGAPDPWDTAFVGKWHLVSFDRPDAAGHPLAQGFAWHEGSLANLGNSLTVSGPRDYYRWEESLNGEPAVVERYATQETTDDALDRLEHLVEPWLLVVSYNASHVPLHDPPAELVDGFVPTTELEQFDAATVAVDRELGRLLDGVDPAVLARTTTILLSDNGTSEYGIAPPFDPSAGKGTLNELGIRIPLVVTGPPVGAPGSTSDALVHVTDVFATVAELAGLHLDPRGGGRDSVSFLGALADPGSPAVRTELISESFASGGDPPLPCGPCAVRDERYKLVRDRFGVEELYAVSADALEGAERLADGSSEEERRELLALRARLEAYEQGE